MIAISKMVLAASLLMALGANALSVGQAREPATFFVAPTGDDRNPGTMEEPWGTLRQSFKRLEPGDELIVRGGSYQEGTLYVGLKGEPDAPITIRNRQGERPIVDGRHLEFLGDQGDQWEVVDPAIHLFRSKDIYEEDTLTANLEQDGKLFKLNVYSDYERLIATRQSWSKEQPFYVGPGVHHSEDGHLYIRLERPDPAAIFMEPDVVERLPPASVDPNENRLHIGTLSTGMQFLKKARHVTVEGLDFEMQRYCLRIKDSSFLTFRNFTIRCGKWAMTIADSHDITVDGVAFELNIPSWISWSDVKSKPKPAGSLKGTGIAIDDGVFNVEIARSRFVDVFDGVVAVSKDLHHMRVHHNFFTTKDDALQLGTSTSDIEFDHNLVIGPGPSHHGTGNAAEPGKKYFHHNIIDASRPILWGRHDPDLLLEPKRRGWRHHRPIGTHKGSTESASDPWKIYQNTFLLGRDAGSGGVGMRKWGDGPVDAIHEAFNNIVLQTEDEWAIKGWSVDGRDEIYDGNLFFRSADRFTTSLIKGFVTGGVKEDFYSLADFRQSSLAEASTSFYAPGWESQGVEADPGLGKYLNGDYRPASDGPAASGAIDLRGKPWPGVENTGTYRGAVDPEAAGGLGDIGPKRPQS